MAHDAKKKVEMKIFVQMERNGKSEVPRKVVRMSGKFPVYPRLPFGFLIGQTEKFGLMESELARACNGLRSIARFVLGVTFFNRLSYNRKRC